MAKIKASHIHVWHEVSWINKIAICIYWTKIRAGDNKSYSINEIRTTAEFKNFVIPRLLLPNVKLTLIVEGR